MFRNLHEEASPGYLQFLEWIGQKITLEGWPSYAGGLDTKRNTTGTHTIWCTISPQTLTDPNPEVEMQVQFQQGLQARRMASFVGTACRVH